MQCKNCSKEISYLRKGTEFCSDKCRKEFWYKSKKKDINTEKFISLSLIGLGAIATPIALPIVAGMVALNKILDSPLSNKKIKKYFEESQLVNEEEISVREFIKVGENKIKQLEEEVNNKKKEVRDIKKAIEELKK